MSDTPLPINASATVPIPGMTDPGRDLLSFTIIYTDLGSCRVLASLKGIA
jgi:hypothetical protein